MISLVFLFFFSLASTVLLLFQNFNDTTKRDLFRPEILSFPIDPRNQFEIKKKDKQ